MKYNIDELEIKIKNSIHDLGFLVPSVTLNPSNRPDLGDYQYNGAMALAKANYDNPLNIANKIVDKINIYGNIMLSIMVNDG